MVLQAIKYTASPPSLEILDQLVLPHTMLYISIDTCTAAHDAIKSMKVRGAPAIALVAVLALAVELASYKGENVHRWIHEKLDYLVTSRPTAVNLQDAANKLKKVVDTADNGKLVATYNSTVEKMLQNDVEDNLSIGRNGAKHILKSAKSDKFSVLTICNTGSLATAGYGTAYSVVHNLHKSGYLHCAYFCETRPFNQGARLTSTELLYDKIPSTMVIDSSVAALLGGANPKAGNGVEAIIVGADRVARNGDTANKIGTYQLAILAKHFGVQLLVAAPWTTIDLDTESGAQITVEQRPQKEVRQVHGALPNESQNGIVERGYVEICGEDVEIWNPAFDVTPKELISGIVTEAGVFVKNEHGEFNLPEEKRRLTQNRTKITTLTTSAEEAQ